MFVTMFCTVEYLQGIHIFVHVFYTVERLQEVHILVKVCTWWHVRYEPLFYGSRCFHGRNVSVTPSHFSLDGKAHTSWVSSHVVCALMKKTGSGLQTWSLKDRSKPWRFRDRHATCNIHQTWSRSFLCIRQDCVHVLLSFLLGCGLPSTLSSFWGLLNDGSRFFSAPLPVDMLSVWWRYDKL